MVANMTSLSASPGTILARHKAANKAEATGSLERRPTKLLGTESFLAGWRGGLSLRCCCWTLASLAGVRLLKWATC